MYNTVDAALLFLDVVYEYYLETGDVEFVREAFPVMEDIVFWYQKGTDFHIKMDSDGLIMAGGGLEQVTWMDVRIDKELPTPRHGKPVEINAYWYNGLRILEEAGAICRKGWIGVWEACGAGEEEFPRKVLDGRGRISEGCAERHV